MKSLIWTKAVGASADPARARHYLALLNAASGGGGGPALDQFSAEQAGILCALFSGSQALSNWLVAHPEAVAWLKPELLRHPRRKEGLQRDVDAWLVPALRQRDYPGALRRLREFKQRELLRLAARDLAGWGPVPEIIQELSNVADVCLETVLQACRGRLVERWGEPFHQDPAGRWQPTPFCVIGLGKLGGQELNYSSDVDVIFVHAEEGRVFRPPPEGRATAGVMSNHEYFTRLAEDFVGEVGRIAPEGPLYRIDLRLRPEGQAGPLARSLAGYENYYAQWGQTWERLMLIKARCVAGDAVLAAEFLETVQPFRYPRSVSPRVVRDVAAMKDRIEIEVVRAGEIDRNVKLGRGGIREIEFVVQTLQLLNAGRMPFLQGAQTLPALEKLADYELLERPEARRLGAAYGFLRRVEHRLQMEDNLQTHTIPASKPARERLAALMGFKNFTLFEAERKRQAGGVRRLYDRFLRPDPGESRRELPRELDGAEWLPILADHSFKRPEQALRLLHEFARGPGYVHVSRRTTELAFELLPVMLGLCPRRGAAGGSAPVLSDPDRVLTRLDAFITAYGTRAMLFETWNTNPAFFELLLLLFDRSEFLAEIAIRTPDRVESLVAGGRLRQRKTAAETLADLRHGRNDADQRLWLRRYHQSELMRIGLRDILGLADIEQNLAELSALAEACLQYGLEVVLRQHRLKRAPLVIIGLGKLGGAEINYGSDLDILFIAGARAGELPKLQRLAIEVMELLSSHSELGVAFKTDARLRPDGEKGLLVNTLDACAGYYRLRAQLWEIQSISRARPVAGDLELGERFMRMAAILTDFRGENVARGFGSAPGLKSGRASGRENPRSSGAAGLAAYAPDWKQRIAQMRRRIEKERTPPGQDALAIKTGAGGLMDAEFIAQTLCLANGWLEPNTLKALLRAKDLGVLGRAEAELLIENYRRLRRVEGILRRWSFAGETVLPVEAEPFQRVAVRCGFKQADDFRNALGEWRRGIRAVFESVLAVG